MGVAEAVGKARSDLRLGIGCCAQTCQPQPHGQQHSRDRGTRKLHALLVPHHPEHNLDFNRVLAYKTRAVPRRLAVAAI
jgi:hypothetical protein